MNDTRAGWILIAGSIALVLVLGGALVLLIAQLAAQVNAAIEAIA